MGKEQRSKLEIRYSSTNKGKFLFSNGNVKGNKKKNTKKVVTVMLDTGNIFKIEGQGVQCYDTHSLSAKEQEMYPSTAALFADNCENFYENYKDYDTVWLVTHDFPDNDAIISLFLATYLLKNGKLPLKTDEFVRVANESDSFKFSFGVTLGAILSKYINSKFPKNQDLHASESEEKWQKMRDLVNLCFRINELYENRIKSDHDIGIGEEISIDEFISEIFQPNCSSYYANKIKEYDELRLIRNDIIKEEKFADIQYEECMATTCELATWANSQEIFMKTKKYDDKARKHAHDIVKTPMCKKQVLEDDKIKSSEENQECIIYTGYNKPGIGLSRKFNDAYPLSIIPFYDNDKGTLTVKVSSNSDELDLGHLGRFIECELYKEALSKSLAGECFNRSEKEFLKRKKEFTKMLKPLLGKDRSRHFTGFQPLCGTGRDYVGFTVSSKSYFYDLYNISALIFQYLDEPKEIDTEYFYKEIGKEGREELITIIEEYEKEQAKVSNEETKLEIEESAGEISNATDKCIGVEEKSSEIVSEELTTEEITAQILEAIDKCIGGEELTTEEITEQILETIDKCIGGEQESCLDIREFEDEE